MKPVDIPKALSLLDQELAKMNLKAELTICGGAALIMMGVVSRETVDVDVIADQIPDAVLTAAKLVAKKLKCREDWLNNRVSPLIQRLPVDWERHLITLFTGRAVTVRSISRQDLINGKLHAAIDRKASDYSDLIELKPTVAEIEIARRYCLWQAKSDTYEVWVNGYVDLLKKDLGVS